ncbi:MAG: patatin family protein [Bacteroidia bacterium]|nr:patatin family protein [Bacteroidia bacterium]
MKKTLIVQGGGFRTGFSSGALDAFMQKQYDPFDLYIAVSGGAIATSYYIAKQPKHCFNAICFLSEKGKFVNYSNFFKFQPVMDVDVFYAISDRHFPFDRKAAEAHLEQKQFAIVMTDKTNGQAFYGDPLKSGWEETVIASCSLPFITKGKHTINGIDYMDGAWGDPLPVEWAVKNGATDITVIRTAPANEKMKKSWIDYLGETYYRKNEKIRKAFTENYLVYNRSIDFINDPPKGVVIKQVAPMEELKAGSYTNSIQLLEEDYWNGYNSGMDYLSNL